jgi:hypothetical protein
MRRPLIAASFAVVLALAVLHAQPSSSVVPLATPGAGWSGAKMLLDSRGPLVVRKRYWLQAMPWLWRFARVSDEATVNRIAGHLLEILSPTLTTWQRVLTEIGATDLYQPSGQLHVYPSEAAMLADGFAWGLRERLGVHTERLDRAALQDRQPGIAPHYAAGVFLPDAATITDPHGLCLRLAAALRARGVEFITTEVRAIAADGEVDDGDRRWPGERCVLAAGAWSMRLARALGVRLPLESQRGYHVQRRQHEVAPGIRLNGPVVAADSKVFIVPMVICYNFVLEAPFLIEQHLRITGKENYLRLKDEGTSVRAWLRFIWRFFSTTSDITLSIGKPMDVLGNFVDGGGRSFDRFGNELDIREYFMGRKDEINEDRQREEEYTKLLAERIVERYQVENVVLSSHLVAYTVFEMLVHQNPKLDLFGILRLPHDDYVFPMRAVVEVVEQIQERLVEMEQQNKIHLAPEIHHAATDVVRDGVKNLGVFHTEKPLGLTKEGDIVSSNFLVLYFYHNRLDNYQLDKYVHWKAEEIEVLKVD